MEIGFNKEKIKNFLIGKNLRKNFFIFLAAQTSLLTFFVILIMVGYCVYIWYDNIYAPEWNEMKKQEYARSKNQTVNFNQGGFQDVVSEFELRKVQSQKNLENPVDIFRLKK